MSGQIQTFWDSMPVELHAPSNNTAAALAINAWDNIGKGIGNLGTKLIEEPMSKLYRADLNAGRDISGYDPLALTNKVLEDTPTVRGQLLENDTKAFDLGLKKAKEDSLVQHKDLLDQMQLAYNSRDYAKTRELYNQAMTLGIRPDVLKEYLNDIGNAQRLEEQLNIQKSGDARKWARFNDDIAERERLRKLGNDARYYAEMRKTMGDVLDIADAANWDEVSRATTPEERNKAIRDILLKSEKFRDRYNKASLKGKEAIDNSINRFINNFDRYSLGKDAMYQIMVLNGDVTKMAKDFFDFNQGSTSVGNSSSNNMAIIK